MNCKIKILAYLLIFLSLSCGQKNNSLALPEGIWIEKSYYKSFEKTKSAIGSKNAFSPEYPAGLRINYKEFDGSILNIGYSRLHDHIIRPEVSKSAVNLEGDTIYEQGFFNIDTNKISNDGYFQTSTISCFNGNAELRYDERTNTIEMLNTTNREQRKIKIEYIRIDSIFENLYQFPNPIYYFTRKYSLSGKYTIQDSLGNTLSDNLDFKSNGNIKGFKKFDNMKLYYSTDVYCGPPMTDDRIVIIDDVLSNNRKSYAFNITINEPKEVLLSGYNRKQKKWDNLTYKLIKN